MSENLTDLHRLAEDRIGRSLLRTLDGDTRRLADDALGGEQD